MFPSATSSIFQQTAWPGGHVAAKSAWDSALHMLLSLGTIKHVFYRIKKCCFFCQEVEIIRSPKLQWKFVWTRFPMFLGLSLSFLSSSLDSLGSTLGYPIYWFAMIYLYVKSAVQFPVISCSWLNRSEPLYDLYAKPCSERMVERWHGDASRKARHSATSFSQGSASWHLTPCLTPQIHGCAPSFSGRGPSVEVGLRSGSFYLQSLLEESSRSNVNRNRL